MFFFFFKCNALYINVHFHRPLKIRTKCAKSAGGHLGTWWINASIILPKFTTYYTPFFLVIYRKGKDIVHMDVYGSDCSTSPIMTGSL